MRVRDLMSFQRPSNRDYRSVRHWIANENPLVPREQEFVQWREDIVTLRHGRECTGFDSLVEAVLQKMNCKLIRVRPDHNAALPNPIVKKTAR